MIFKSDYGKNELIARFDDLTSEARFAGADEQNDWIFLSTRKGDKIKIIRKPKNAYDPFASVFRGRIVGVENGSEIRGFYTKSLPDYIFSLFVFSIYYTVCFNYYASADDKTVSLSLMIAGAAVLLLLFSSLPHTRKRYGDFIRRVTEGEAVQPRTAEAEAPENEPDAEEKKEDVKEEKNKFRFRF